MLIHQIRGKKLNSEANLTHKGRYTGNILFCPNKKKKLLLSGKKNLVCNNREPIQCRTRIQLTLGHNSFSLEPIIKYSPYETEPQEFLGNS